LFSQVLKKIRGHRAQPVRDPKLYELTEFL
jgi:hypothetical protein